MKLNRLSSSDLNRTSQFDHWLRNPFAGFSAVSQLLESLPDLRTPNEPIHVPTDVFEDSESYSVHFEMPGVRKEDVKLEIHDERLTLTAVKRHAGANSEASTALTRIVSIPQGIERDVINAKLEHGILRVTLPKSADRKPKTIEIL